MRKQMTTLVLLALIGTAPLVAQEPERERERREMAQRQMQEAREQLERAIEQLRDAETSEARRELMLAIEKLQMAQRELLDESGFRIMRRSRPGGVSVFSYGGDAPQMAMFEGRPRMGVLLQTNPDEAADRVGALVSAVTPFSPADEAGLKAGDIITEANGVVLASSGRRSESPGAKLIELVRAAEDGDELRVTYQRDGATRTATITLRVMEDDAFVYAFGDSLSTRIAPRLREFISPEVFVEPRLERLRVEPGELIAEIVMPGRWLNIELVTLDDDLGAYFGTTEGLLVIRAPEDEGLGLRSGDVILEIDGRTPTSPSHALRILRSYEEGETVAMQVMRNKSRRTVEVTVPEHDWDFDFQR